MKRILIFMLALLVSCAAFAQSPISVRNGGTGVATISGLIIGNATSPFSAYGGTSCTNQFPRSLSASGAATCASVANTDLSNSAITIAGIATSLGSSITLDSITGLSGTGLVNRTAANTLAPYAGTSCSNQFPRSLSAAGAATCASVALASDVSGTLPVANGGTGIASGTSGGVLAYTASGTLASSGALTANLPVIGGGAGAAPTVGTRSGNTTSFATTTGTLPSGDFAKFDASGNLVDGGASSSVLPLECVRLYSTTGIPAPTSDTTTVSMIYVGPFDCNTITLLDGSNNFVNFTLTEISLALSSLTSGKNYDVFVYSNSGTLTIELSAAWTSDTARNDAVAAVNGLNVKSSAHTRLLVGTIRTTGTTSTTDTAAKRFVFSWFNRVPRALSNVAESTGSWTYTTNAFRQANANTANQLDYVTGDASSFVNAFVYHFTSASAVASVSAGIGIDSTTVNSAQTLGGNAAVATVTPIPATYIGQPGLGRHYIVWLERSVTTTGTTTWYGQGTSTTIWYQTGITGSLLM